MYLHHWLRRFCPRRPPSRPVANDVARTRSAGRRTVATVAGVGGITAAAARRRTRKTTVTKIEEVEGDDAVVAKVGRRLVAASDTMMSRMPRRAAAAVAVAAVKAAVLTIPAADGARSGEVAAVGGTKGRR